MPRPPSPSADEAAAILEQLAFRPDPGEDPESSLRKRREQCLRPELLGYARRLGLDVRAKSRKKLIHDQVEAALALYLSTRDAPEVESADPVHKFDLGQPTQLDAEPEQVPWGYGRDQVRAMVVDPDRLFVYWEVTDDAIERARARLGASGAGAWLDLRMYDVSGRIFDGTNANSYLDQRVERTDRRWFFDVGRPTSSACVEVGLLSEEGWFQRIARSGRVEFPRKEPSEAGGVEWLTVGARTGPAGEAVAGNPPAAQAEEVAAPQPIGESETAGIEGWEDVVRHALAGGGGAWLGSVLRTAWEAGPFDFPVESPLFVEQHYDPNAQVVLIARKDGTRVVYGPWRVVIRRLGTDGEQPVVDAWEMQYTFGGPVSAVLEAARLAPGASELLLLGASERLYGGASERLHGASEHRLPAFPEDEDD